jgi:hypothetical protein
MAKIFRVQRFRPLAQVGDDRFFGLSNRSKAANILQGKIVVSGPLLLIAGIDSVTQPVRLFSVLMDAS